MNAASAPGPDGVPNNFYRTFFGAIQSALLVMVNGFLVDGLRPTSFRESRIVLIPKADGDRSNPEAWRLISLLNADYKIVTSLLARRISTTLPDLIHQAQTSSVSGRLVFANLALARDSC